MKVVKSCSIVSKVISLPVPVIVGNFTRISSTKRQTSKINQGKVI